MEKRLRKSILLGQNFLKSPKLARKLVGMSSISLSDTVVEIGAGRGIITGELATKAKQVIAIERDRALAERLRERFSNTDNVSVIREDFLEFRVRYPEYKIFASIPFNITAQVIRRVLFASPGLRAAYLIVQKESAMKFSGRPRETLISVLSKPFFDVRVIGRMQRTDFEPVPNVDSVLLSIEKRHVALLTGDEIEAFHDFAQRGFRSCKPHLRLAFKDLCTYRQWKRISKEFGFPVRSLPSELSIDQWIGLFRAIKRNRSSGPWTG